MQHMRPRRGTACGIDAAAEARGRVSAAAFLRARDAASEHALGCSGRGDMEQFSGR